MKLKIQNSILIVFLLFFLQSCGLIEDIFEAGLVVGIVIVLVVIALLIFLVVKLIKAFK